jgi:hypothetical protein
MRGYLARWHRLLAGPVEVRVYRDVTPEVVDGVVR